MERRYNIAPGTDGYIAAQQMGMQRQAQEMGVLSKIIALDQAQKEAAQAAEMRPLQMEALRAQIAERQAGVLRGQQQQAAQGALSSLLATGGYHGGPQEAPTMVAGSEDEARRAIMEATAKGIPMGVNLPNPQNVRALTSMAFPAEFGKAQAAALFPKPVAPQTPRQNIVPVTGGYLQPNATGAMEFVRTQQPGAERPEPAPIKVTDANGNVKLYDRAGNLIKDLGVIGAPNPATQKANAARLQTLSDINTVINELTEATKDGGLIDKSTGSGAGAAVDIAAGFFGKATPGAVAVGQLKPIFDLVLKMVPRFEGPQSDKDTQSYKEAAGAIANPNVPNDTKKAAGKEILRLMKARRNQFVTKDVAGTEASQKTRSASSSACSECPSRLR